MDMGMDGGLGRRRGANGTIGNLQGEAGASCWRARATHRAGKIKTTDYAILLQLQLRFLRYCFYAYAQIQMQKQMQTW